MIQIGEFELKVVGHKTIFVLFQCCRQFCIILDFLRNKIVDRVYVLRRTSACLAYLPLDHVALVPLA